MTWNIKTGYQKYIPGDIVKVCGSLIVNSGFLGNDLMDGDVCMVHSVGYRGDKVWKTASPEYTLFRDSDKSYLFVSCLEFDKSSKILHRFIPATSDWCCHHYCRMSSLVGCGDCIFTNPETGKSVFPSASEFFFLGDEVIVSKAGHDYTYSMRITNISLGPHKGEIYSADLDDVFFLELWSSEGSEFSRTEYFKMLRYGAIFSDLLKNSDREAIVQSSYCLDQKGNPGWCSNRLRLRQRRGYTIDPGISGVCSTCIYSDCKNCDYYYSEHYQQHKNLNSDDNNNE